MPYADKADNLASQARFRQTPEWLAWKRQHAKTPLARYYSHKSGAKKRGIEFLLSFDQWWKLWKPYWKTRGTCSDCHVMARFGDKGPYAVGNVRIITSRENIAEKFDVQANRGKKRVRVLSSVQLQPSEAPGAVEHTGAEAVQREHRNVPVL